MEIRKMEAARGWIWVKHGYQLIKHGPLMAVSLAMIAALILFLTLRAPVVGPLLAVLVIPVVLAGYMRVCRALEDEQEVELAYLFEGFQKHTGRLIALGGFTILGLFGTSAVIVLIGGDALTHLLNTFHTVNDPQVLAEAMWAAGSGVALSLIAGFTLVCALMLALQYAPMLIFFQNVTPIAAMRASLIGSLRNLIPYTVYTIIMQAIAFVLAFLPFDLGLFVLLPLGLTSLYVSYRNIFPFAHELAANEPVTNNPEP